MYQSVHIYLSPATSWAWRPEAPSVRSCRWQPCRCPTASCGPWPQHHTGRAGRSRDDQTASHSRWNPPWSPTRRGGGKMSVKAMLKWVQAIRLNIWHWIFYWRYKFEYLKVSEYFDWKIGLDSKPTNHRREATQLRLQQRNKCKKYLYKFDKIYMTRLNGITQNILW